jgi:hypothetical protein
MKRQMEGPAKAVRRSFAPLVPAPRFTPILLIENKLDDSGRDVVWQALKYASYCSSLSKSQIVAIHQNCIGWLTKHVKSLEKAFGGRLKPLGQKLKAEFNSAGAFQEEVEG